MIYLSDVTKRTLKSGFGSYVPYKSQENVRALIAAPLRHCALRHHMRFIYHKQSTRASYLTTCVLYTHIFYFSDVFNMLVIQHILFYVQRISKHALYVLVYCVVGDKSFES